MTARYRFLTAAVLFAALLPMTAGCELMQKLKARDELNKGVKAYTGQRWDVAEEHFRKAIELDPELNDAVLYLAATYRSQWIPGIPSEDNLNHANWAIETFEKVLEKDPNNINAMANIAGIYDGLGENERAKEWYRKRIAVDADNAEPYYGIATLDWKVVHEKTGLNGENAPNLTEEERVEVEKLLNEGVDSLQKALELNPRYSDAMQYLNLLYRERSYLAVDEEEKKNWQKEADKLALQALEIKRELEEEAERARRSFGGKAEKQPN